jgi:hypothetical protein
MKRMEMILSGCIVLLLIIAVYFWKNHNACFHFMFMSISVMAFYYWHFSKYNLWTDSIPASLILKNIAIMLILLTPISIVFHWYFGVMLRIRIILAKNQINRAHHAGAAAYSTTEFDKAETLLSKAIESRLHGQYRNGIRLAIESEKVANHAISMVDNNRDRMRHEVEELYPTAIDICNEIKLNADKNGIDDQTLSLIDQIMEQLPQLIEESNYARARKLAGLVIQIQKDINNISDI